jgi:hypothetical protein
MTRPKLVVRLRDASPGRPSSLNSRHRRFTCRTLRPISAAALGCVRRFSRTRRINSPRSISLADIVTNPFGISPPKRARDASQRGHFYLGQRGHLNLGATCVCPITDIMSTSCERV